MCAQNTTSSATVQTRQALVFQKPALFKFPVQDGRIVASIKSDPPNRKPGFPAHGVRINLLFKGTPEEMSAAKKRVAQAGE